MLPTFILLLLIALLTGTVSLAILHWRFRCWPPHLWKQQLCQRIVELSNRRLALQRDAAQSLEPAARRLADEFFCRHLRSIPLEPLAEYPGVGPATLERLRQAGCRGIADVTTARIADIEGIGPTRERDITAAVAALVQSERSRFEAGASAEAHEYRERLERLSADEQGVALARSRELTALNDALQQADKLNDVARHVTLWGYLTHRDVPGLAEALSQPLPTARELPPIPVAWPASPAAPPVDLFHAELQKPADASQRDRAEHPLLPKMRAIVGFAFAVAKSDGRVAEAERKAIREYLAARFGHDTVLVRHIDTLMQQTEAAIADETAALAAVREMTTASERTELYELAERIAGASSGRNARESTALLRIATSFGMFTERPPVVAAAAQAAPAPVVAAAVPDSKTILEISPDVSVTVDLIRRRYALLSEKLDPAKAASMGPEFRRMAEEKRARLRAAAEDLLRPFGAPLDPPAAPAPPADIRHNPDLDDVFGA